MGGAGRPREGKTVVTRLPDDVIARIDQWAKTNQMTRAAAMRYIITTYLGHESS